jgi:hypothetical protein
MATRTNDEIEQDHAEFFAYDPMWCVGKWRPAMLADPSHESKAQQRICHPDSSLTLKLWLPYVADPRMSHNRFSD